MFSHVNAPQSCLQQTTRGMHRFTDIFLQTSSRTMLLKNLFWAAMREYFRGEALPRNLSSELTTRSSSFGHQGLRENYGPSRILAADICEPFLDSRDAIASPRAPSVTVATFPVIRTQPTRKISKGPRCFYNAYQNPFGLYHAPGQQVD